MKDYFVSLTPEEDFKKLVKQSKRNIYEQFGKQEYLSEPPHITLFILSTEREQEVLREIEDISKNLKKMNIGLEKIKVFQKDPRTGKNTIVYPIEKTLLIKLQSEVMLRLNKFNTGRFISKNMRKFSKEEIRNIENYKYPFIGDSWIPHITICSIEDQITKKTLDILNKNPLKEKVTLDSLDLYEISDKLKLIRRFKLI